MKIAKRVLIILSIILLLLFLICWWLFQSNRTDYNEQSALSGLEATVDVYYDQYAIPHIYATSTADAYTALGYVHAKERLWQMEVLRRIVPGKLSAVFGDATLESDRFFRAIDMEGYGNASAERFLTKGDPKVRDLVTAYLNGVNQFIDRGPSPIEFKLLGIEKSPFTLEDIFYISDYMAFSFAMAHKTEPVLTYIRDTYGPTYLEDLDVHVDTSTVIIQSHERDRDFKDLSFRAEKVMRGLPAPVLIGSNSWVVGPERTATGKVLFANDPHIGFGQPAVWFEAHIEAPGVSLYGNYISGYPFPHLGHTNHHAIGLTMFENDDIDLFREKINTENRNQYLYNGQWKDFVSRESVIEVKGGENETFRHLSTVHGPVISGVSPGTDTSETISMWWTYFQFPNQLLATSYTLMFATNMDEARKGASMIHGPGLNVMYGDVDGNIAWWASAKLPKRPDHVNSKLILDGTTDKDEVKAYYDFTENPHAENPPWGYVYSANNQSKGNNGVLHPGYYLPEDRGRRIAQMLESRKDWDVDNTKQMLLDVQSVNAPEIIHAIINVVDKDAMSDHARSAIEKLANWNGAFTSSSTEAVIYTKLLYKILELGMKDELGDWFDLYNGTHVMKRSTQVLIENPDSPWWDDIVTAEEEELDDIAILALEDGLKELELQLGPDQSQWRWDRVHTLLHPHALGSQPLLSPYLNVGPFGVSGNTEVINNLQFKLSPDGTYEVFAGPSCRRIVDFADLENNSWSILPTGQSGNVLSPHYKDQAEMYVRGEFRQKMMNKEAIIKSKMYHSIFKPK